MEQQDLLLGLEDEIYLKRVRSGIRFANYLVDLIAFRTIIFIVTKLIIAFDPDDYANFISGLGQVGLFVVNYLFSMAIIVLYYTILEGSTRGSTLGKVVTGTRVVMSDGSFLTWNAAFMRSLSRIVPFEPFSAFSGNPWHDSWTNTVVIKSRR